MAELTPDKRALVVGFLEKKAKEAENPLEKDVFKSASLYVRGSRLTANNICPEPAELLNNGFLPGEGMNLTDEYSQLLEKGIEGEDVDNP